ncbi:MAG: dicarboxylate/amino acid:cation symporter [Gammaproteobacteria bacterium]|nr:MAG: dicarboxylate/amino acid:cation symporter [Gammaproteobacteria bacterium]|tara:strand:- start:1096 stop:2328 length:1233 start_codon:yes stop_codon:yes gene_type:complete
MSYTTRILLSMLLGISFGSLINVFFLDYNLILFLVEILSALGAIFISSLKLMVVPLVFFSLVTGVAQITDSSKLGSISIKAIFLYLATTSIAISLALFFSNLFNIGSGAGLISEAEFLAPSPPSLKEVFINIFPTNPIASMANGEMLQIIVFSLLVGMGVKSLSSSANLINFFVSGNNLMLRIVELIIWFAPIGIFCLLTDIFSQIGFSVIYDLAGYFLLLVAVLLFHGIFVYSFFLYSFTKLNPIVFFSKLKEVIFFAFSTSSSSATMPLTLKTAKDKLGVDQSVASFTIPLGATINMDGTAIMQGVATVFISQVYGVDLTTTDFLMVILTATLASIGTAGVPGVGLIMLAMVLQQVGLPVEGIALIIGVDRLLDMVRTSVNVCGDSMIACLISSSENNLSQEIFYGDR